MGKGSILVETCVKGCARNIQMHDLFHVPDLHSNLLSVRKFISRGLKVHFNLLGCVVRASNGKVLGLASLKFNLYQLDINMMNGSQINYLVHSNASSYPLEILRKWLGHLNNNIVKMIQSMVGGT